MKFNQNLVFKIIPISIILVMTGCSAIPLKFSDSKEDIPNVYVSAYPEVPWEEISSQLEPKNNLSMDDARKLAAVTTQSQINQVISSLAAGLAINMPTISRSATSTVTSGQLATSSTNTNTTGSVRSSSNTPSLKLPDLTADLSKSLQNMQIDGNTYINDATALFQQAQILDNQISKEFFPDDYSVHLITLQINVQPKHRDVSADVYTDVSFWPTALFDHPEQTDSTEKLPPVVVYPLIISDAMEISSVDKSMQMIKQAALQLSGSIGAFGINGGFGSGKNSLNQIIGMEKNSLVTVGRINSNTVRVRLGAEYAGKSDTGLGLVPRVYNISFAVMTRDSTVVISKNNYHTLLIVTHSFSRSTEDGHVLNGVRYRTDLANKVKNEVNVYGYRINHCAKKEVLTNDDADKNCIDVLLNLLREADHQDLSGLKCDLNLVLTTKSQQKFIRFISSLTEIQGNSQYEDFIIPIKHFSQQLPSNDSLAILSDDGSNSTSISVFGGKGLTYTSNLSAYITVLQDCTNIQNDAFTPVVKTPSILDLQGKHLTISVRGFHNLSCNKKYTVSVSSQCTTSKLYASSIQTKNGTELDISFPSLKSNGLKLSDNNLSVTQGSQTPNTYHVISKANSATTQNISTSIPISISSGTVIADSSNNGEVTLSVGKFDQSQFDPMLLVSGSEIITASTLLAHSRIAIPITSSGIKLSPNKVYILKLGNLSPNIGLDFSVSNYGTQIWSTQVPVSYAGK